MFTEKIKKQIEEVSNSLEKGLDTAEKHVEALKESLGSAWEAAQLRVEAGTPYKDLIGKRVYNVHFVEYQDGLKTMDNVVFVASSPEWALGYCKAHLEMAIKDTTIQDKNWWYFYITEMEINTEGGENWIAAMDWNGNLATNTYHYDKGYNYQYQREHVIYECKDCEENEKEEEVKIAERTAEALTEAEKFVMTFFGASKTITKKDGDFYKIWAVNPMCVQDMRIADYEYAFLHSKFGLTVGNRILFYLTREA